MSEADAARPILVIHAPLDEAFARGYLAPALGGGGDGGDGVGGVGGVRVLAAPEAAALALAELQRPALEPKSVTWRPGSDLCGGRPPHFACSEALAPIAYAGAGGRPPSR